MAKASIVYFDSPGTKNTELVLNSVLERLKGGDIKHVVVASNTGATGKKMISKLKGTDVQIVVVTSQCGFDKEGMNDMDAETESEILSSGAKVVRTTHALSGVERSFSKRLGGASRVESVAEALRSLFGQGMKVCVEITVMAADGGAIPCGDREVIAVAGSDSGADTACVIRPGHANSFFNLEVREILAKPRRRK